MRIGQRFRICALIWGLLLLLPAGCAINPVSGRPEVVLTSVEGEKEIGREAAEKVASTMGLLPLVNSEDELVGVIGHEIGLLQSVSEGVGPESGSS